MEAPTGGSREPIFVYDKAALSHQIKNKNKLVGQTNCGVWPRKRPAVFAQLEGEAVGPSGEAAAEPSLEFPRRRSGAEGPAGRHQERKKNLKKSSSPFSQSPNMAPSHGLCCSVALADGRDISRKLLRADRRAELSEIVF